MRGCVCVGGVHTWFTRRGILYRWTRGWRSRSDRARCLIILGLTWEKRELVSLSLSLLPFSRPICNYREFFDTNDLSLPRNWFLRSSIRSFVCLCYSISRFFAIFFQFSSRDNYIRYYIRNCASILSYRWRDGEIRLMSSKSCRIFVDRRFRRFDFKNFKKGESISFRAIVFKKREKIVSSRGHASAHFSFEYISFPRGEG